MGFFDTISKMYDKMTEYKRVLILRGDINRPYSYLGQVSVTQSKKTRQTAFSNRNEFGEYTGESTQIGITTGSINMDALMVDLQKKAHKMGADAVIYVDVVSGGGIHHGFQDYSEQTLTAYGTAIKFR